MTTQSLRRHGACTIMAFSVLAWKNQGFRQRQEADGRRGRLDLHKQGVGVVDLHRGGHVCPFRAKTPRAPPTARHPGHATTAGTEGTGALGGVTPCDAWSGSTPLPHPSRLDTGRKRQVLDIGGLPSRNQRLEHTSGADGR